MADEADLVDLAVGVGVDVDCAPGVTLRDERLAVAEDLDDDERRPPLRSLQVGRAERGPSVERRAVERFAGHGPLALKAGAVSRAFRVKRSRRRARRAMGLILFFGDEAEFFRSRGRRRGGRFRRWMVI